MKTRVHAIAGGVALLTIVSFWLSTVIAELFLPVTAIVAVKRAVLLGMTWLIPAMAIVGASGFSLASKRRGRLVIAKRRRMPVIAVNGLLVLLPSAIWLYGKAAAGELGAWFYAVQVLELVAGAVNIALLGASLRDGLRLTGSWRVTTGPPASRRVAM
jgi:hypothetical protein